MIKQFYIFKGKTTTESLTNVYLFLIICFRNVPLSLKPTIARRIDWSHLKEKFTILRLFRGSPWLNRHTHVVVVLPMSTSWTPMLVRAQSVCGLAVVCEIPPTIKLGKSMSGIDNKPTIFLFYFFMFLISSLSMVYVFCFAHTCIVSLIMYSSLTIRSYAFFLRDRQFNLKREGLWFFLGKSYCQQMSVSVVDKNKYSESTFLPYKLVSEEKIIFVPTQKKP